MKKRVPMMSMLLCMLIFLAGCGKTIAKSDGFSASMDKDNGGTVSVTVKMPIAKSVLTDETYDRLNSLEPITESEIALADGNSFSTVIHIALNGIPPYEEPDPYVMVSDNLAAMEELLGLNFLESSELTFYPGQNNFFLSGQTGAPGGEIELIRVSGTGTQWNNIMVSQKITIYLGPGSSSMHTVSYNAHHSESADYARYITTGGFTADIVITDDNGTDNNGCACVFLQSNNIIYEYDVVFSTPVDQLTDIEDFLNTIS